MIIMKIQQALHIVQNNIEEKVGAMLIQNACTRYGQAMLTVALHKGYSVYTIEDHQEEIKFIQTNFPQVNI